MIRTKKYICRDYIEIEVFNLSPRKKPVARAKKMRESSPAQKNLNSKKSRRYFRRLCHANFGKGDLAVTLTCDDDHMPADRDELLKWLKNYIRTLKRIWDKEHGSKEYMKYVYVISNHKGDGSDTKARPHIHMIISGMDRDLLESKWKKGFANSKRLQFNEGGIAGLAKYMAGQAKNERSWGSSLHLVKPEPIVSDKAIKKSQLEYIAQNPDDGRYIEKLVNKSSKTRWTFTDCAVEYDGRQIFGRDIEDTGEGMGVSLLIRMRKEYFTR